VITLHDDDPDALEAMLRHIYNFWLRLPSLSLSASSKMRFYCNVVVCSDKYGLPALGNEARKSLCTFLVSLKDPEAVLVSLKIITEDYGDHKLLDTCAVNLASFRLKTLATVADFPGWLASQPQFLRGIIEDAAKLRALPTLPKHLKKVQRFKCTSKSCQKLLLGSSDKSQPYCHGRQTVPDGAAYCEEI
jgi:hypothetical protein